MNDTIIKRQRKKNQQQTIGCLSFVAIAILIYAATSFFGSSSEEEPPLDTESPVNYNESYRPPSTHNEDPYVVMETVFDGNPDKEKTEPLITAVMRNYNLAVTNESILQVANMLFLLKKESKVGVTEMEILKHIYQRGSSTITLTDQAVISFQILESTK